MRTVLALLLPLPLLAQSALLEIRVVDGAGAVYASGSRTPGLTIEVSDELGKPVSGAVVSLRLPDDGAGGAFANGLSSEILTTGSNGRAATSPIRWNRITGTAEIRITAVKGQLRAGTMASCEIKAPARARVITTPSSEPGYRKGLPKKWLILGALAATAAVAGFVGGRAASNGSSSSGSGSSGGGTVTTPLQLGIPTFTVGKP
jgi:hypothetical protein